MTTTTSANSKALRTFIRLLATETDDCLIWPHTTTDVGYGNISFGGRNYGAHRLALEVMVGPSALPRLHAAHSCNTKRCINYRHLRWASPAENAADMTAHGTAMTGARNPNSKLTAEDVAAIRESSEHLEVLAPRYGVTRRTIRDARYGYTYRDLPMPDPMPVIDRKPRRPR